MKRLTVYALVLAIGLTLVTVSHALAHERRTVGKYQLVVGFLNEPAYAGYTNGIDFRVTNTETNKPVEGLEKTVKAEVIVGGKTLQSPLATRFGQPGAYAGYFVPTKPGAYVFHFTGDIEGTKLDEKFESGPGRFNEVEDTIPLQFPEKLPNPIDAAAQVQSARDAAASAQTIAYVGVALGVLGVVTGGWSLMKRK